VHRKRKTASLGERRATTTRKKNESGKLGKERLCLVVLARSLGRGGALDGGATRLRGGIVNREYRNADRSSCYRLV
jgi:hypothetical protein